MIVSIAIPVFRQEEFLPTALASVAVQARPFRLAVMDATADNSVQRVLSPYRHMVDYSRHGPDDGQAAAIQEGWDRLDGDILHWLNADDYLLPSTLESVIAVFEAHPEIDVVYGDALFVDRAGAFTTYFPAISDQADSLTETCCIAQPACFVRRQAVERVGGLNTGLHYIMDWDLWTRLYEADAKFFYLRRPLAAVRMYPETKTGGGSSERLREIRRHLAKHAGFGTALRATAAFIADNGRGNGSFISELVRRSVQAYRRCRVAMARAGLGSVFKELYGIEVQTNRVKAQAEIWLPWYEEQAPRRLLVTGQWSHITAEVNGAKLGKENARGGEREQAFSLSQGPADQRLWRVTLGDEGGRPWRLATARLE